MLQVMRAMGVGKTVFVTGAEEEIESLVQYMDAFVGQALHFQVRKTFER